MVPFQLARPQIVISAEMYQCGCYSVGQFILDNKATKNIWNQTKTPYIYIYLYVPVQHINLGIQGCHSRAKGNIKLLNIMLPKRECMRQHSFCDLIPWLARTRRRLERVSKGKGGAGGNAAVRPGGGCAVADSDERWMDLIIPQMFSVELGMFTKP